MLRRYVQHLQQYTDATSECPPHLASWKPPQLNERYDPNDTKNIVRLLDCFEFKNHLCLVFELLSINLYELLKQNQFRGLPLPLIRHFIKQILEVNDAHARWWW